MSINLSVGFQIPTNVVEVGTEITADQLAAITNASTPSAANPFLTTSAASFLPLAGGTMTGAIVVTAINSNTNVDITFDAYNDTGAGTHFLHTFDAATGKLNLATNGGGLTFPDGTIQTVAGYPNTNPSGFITSSYTYEPKKAVANLCASCFISNGSTFYFTNYVALCVAQGTKFTTGSAFLLGLGIPANAPTYTFALTSSSASQADTGISYTSVAGHNVCYSEDSGSSWTYSDLTF
jgi:hypothetical protein